ncbi:MAG: DUF6141 family protein [Planctomycetota bacterium]|jgi:hypothetical protein
MTEENENEVIFREVQRFGLWLRWVLVLSVPVLVAILASVGVAGGNFTEPSFILSLLVGILVLVAVAVLFLTLRLETEVRPDGLYVRFFPFHIRHKRFEAQDLSECYARQYRPILEYGGWGIKCGKNGKAYNVSGNQGVQLVFKNSRQLLIGTQRAQELAEAISSIMTSA